MGSLAFAAAARAVWAVTKDPTNPERRLLLPAKLNLARDPDGLAYRIDDGKVVWEYEPVAMHADDAFAAEAEASTGNKQRGNERQDAIRWLRERLASGPASSSDVIGLGGELGYSKRTLQRAYRELGGKPRKETFDGPWVWELPSQHATEDASPLRPI